VQVFFLAWLPAVSFVTATVVGDRDRLGWLYLVLTAVECAIGMFFVVKQQKIFLDLNKDTGVVHIAQGGRFGAIGEDDLDLSGVQSFHVEEHESNVQRRLALVFILYRRALVNAQVARLAHRVAQKAAQQ